LLIRDIPATAGKLRFKHYRARRFRLAVAIRLSAARADGSGSDWPGLPNSAWTWLSFRFARYRDRRERR
jgi:hypothetical protein